VTRGLVLFNLVIAIAVAPLPMPLLGHIADAIAIASFALLIGAYGHRWILGKP
jgi:hypothetical protein